MLIQKENAFILINRYKINPEKFCCEENSLTELDLNSIWVRKKNQFILFSSPSCASG